MALCFCGSRSLMDDFLSVTQGSVDCLKREARRCPKIKQET